MKKITLIATLCAAACALSAQQYFVGNCDKDALSYKCGEPMNFQIGLFETASLSSVKNWYGK